jgi:hypothetical protein
MSRAPDKWFAMRPDFFGQDNFVLGFYKLSPKAMGLYVASIAYASRWGTDTCYGNHLARMLGMQRPKAVIEELVEHGFWHPADAPRSFYVAHEGTLWRRGDGRQRRPIPVEVRAAVMKRDGYACQECGGTRHLSLDHVFPYSKGGTDAADNLRVLCRSCNSKKGDRI